MKWCISLPDLVKQYSFCKNVCALRLCVFAHVHGCIWVEGPGGGGGGTKLRTPILCNLGMQDDNNGQVFVL
eukprot:jgi/Botrbrau1/17674/Bobra.0166s0099.1